MIEYAIFILRGGKAMSDFMPRKQQKEAITIRMEDGKAQRITYLATKFHLSRSAFVNQCVDYALSRLDIDKYKKEDR